MAGSMLELTGGGSDDSNEAMWPRLYPDDGFEASAPSARLESKKRERTILIAIASAVMAASATIIAAVLSAGGLTVLSGVGPVREDVVYGTTVVKKIDPKTAASASPVTVNGHSGSLAWQHSAAPLAWSETGDPRVIDVLVASHGADSCWQVDATATKTRDGYEVSATTGLSTAKFFESAITLSRGFEKGCAGYIDCVPVDDVDFYIPSCKDASQAISETSTVNSSMPKRNGPEPLKGVQVYADYDVVTVPVRLPGEVDDDTVITGEISNEAAVWIDEADDWASAWKARQGYPARPQ